MDGLSNVLDAVLASGASVRRVLFVSSTAVYGDAGGGWIDERTTPEPGGFSGRIIREAEELLHSRLRGTGITPVVLRLGGIYGPGRTRLIDQVRGGTAVIPAASRFTNRIHRDDAAAAIVHLCTMDAVPAPVYLGVDNEPAELGEVLGFLAAELGLPAAGGGVHCVRRPGGGTAPAAARRRRAANRRGAATSAPATRCSAAPVSSSNTRVSEKATGPFSPASASGTPKSLNLTAHLLRGEPWIFSTLSRRSAGSWTSPAWPSWWSAPSCPSPWRCADSSRGRLPAGSAPLSVYRSYRQLLGRSILLGLELLVAADIIRTVAVTPTFESVGVLAIIVLIRTFLSFSLELEITGRWPWQTQREGSPDSSAAG